MSSVHSQSQKGYYLCVNSVPLCLWDSTLVKYAISQQVISCSATSVEQIIEYVKMIFEVNPSADVTIRKGTCPENKMLF